MKLASTVAVVAFLVSCGYETGQPLGDGYHHLNTDAWNTWVVRGAEIIVDSNVTNALAIGEYILGLRVRPERFVGLPEGEISDEYGYFVFDKSTGVLVQGLSEFEVKRVFSENGWNYDDLVDATL
ncbi:MAG: hypothetical protein GXP15_10680 [Gammaproteobacteria bacterium]|nr:hypothetical protein [Gammaproteobacteria bacterium]